MKNQQCVLQIDSANEVCCKVKDKDGEICGKCQSCIFSSKLSDSTQWLWRAGDASKRRFLTGILMRCHSIDILQNVQNILQVTFGKDFTYSRSKPKPSLPEDMSTWSSDRALDSKVIGAQMMDTWDWFSHSHDWIKCNYLLGILSLCDTDLLHMLGNLTRVLLVREKRSFLQFNAQDDEPQDEASSVAESSYTFNSLDRPDLELLVRTSSIYDLVDNDPDLSTLTPGLEVCPASEMPKSRQLTSFTPGTVSFGRTFSKTEQCEDSDTESDDPALMVVPRSSKSLSGVSRYRDFIRSLPVHLAKYILGLLDNLSLLICRDVSRHWRYLAEGTQEDFNTIRTKLKQAMMMQGSTHTGPSPVYAAIREVLVPLPDEEKHFLPVNCFSKHPKEELKLLLMTEVRLLLFCAAPDPPTFARQERGFEDIYTDVRTKVLEMEERNVFCGKYNVAILLDREDSSRVVDYSGGEMVAMGSKDRSACLLELVSQEQDVPVFRGHAGSIRALLICEQRDLLVSGSYDLSIRCWNLKTGACFAHLSGHSGTINCLDMHGDILVSGAKDCRVKVWNLKTGTCYNKLKFKHNNPILCVKLDKTFVMSSCEKGEVKIWNLKTASLVKVIKASQSSVKCLFFDSWHILSGGLEGQVRAWSTNRDMEKCLMTYRHPKEVLTLTLLYLRVITGCADGKIRIFNFLSGECLRVIRAGGQKSPVRSLHIHNNNIIVNTHSSVMLYQFAKVNWDYELPFEKDKRAVFPLNPKSALRRVSHPCVRAERMAHVGSANRRIFNREATEEESMRSASRSEPQGARRTVNLFDLRKKLISQPPSALASGRPVSGYSVDPLSRVSHKARAAPSTPARVPFVTTKWAMTESEKAVLDRVKKRGPHQPLTSDNILLRVNSARKPTDQAALNMELNARVRDTWGSSPPQPSPPAPQLQDLNPPTKVGVFTTTAPGESTVPQRMLMMMKCTRPGRRVTFQVPGNTIPAHQVLDPFKLRGSFSLRTDSQLEEMVRAQASSQDLDQVSSAKKKEKQRKNMIKMKRKGFPMTDFTKEDQVYAPELGPDVYI